MNEKEKDDLLKDADAAIGVIKAQFDDEVIRDYEIPKLVNMNTGENTGFGVKVLLSTRYVYDEELLTEWKRLLKADDWYISVKRNQLHVTFKVRYKKEGDAGSTRRSYSLSLLSHFKRHCGVFLSSVGKLLGKDKKEA